MELIVAYVAKALVLVLSMILYVYLFSRVVPRFIMKLKMVDENTRDRGLKKFVYPNGRCILYETELSARRYVGSYALYTEDGYKYIKCKVADDVGFLKYDVYAFDNQNNIIDIIEVMEYIDKERYTSALSLPPDTSYVRFVLRAVDKKYFSSKVLANYSIIQYGICAGVVALATAIEASLIYSLLKDILKEGLKIRIGISGAFGMTVMVLGISLLTAGLTVLAYMRNSKKVINR